MALSDTNKTIVYQILGMPQSGTAVIAQTVGFDPDTNYFSATDLVNKINTQIATLTADQITLVNTILARWTEITSTSQQVIRDKFGSMVKDDPAERAAIKRQVENIIGIKLPKSPLDRAENNLSIQR